ncbi:MAG: hypothetical protein DRN01_07225 [Thermoplasmata archaeon]|nr:MAG: hypothetical protein DRN01_07225 [Thermoplasmata archaeon]
MKHNKRVIILGLDGATFNVIFPLIKRGNLPNFKELIETGAYGSLRSTIPPLSSSAWASFMTGMNPGNHGVYDFILKKPNSYDTMFLNGSLVRASPFWEIIGREGKKVVIQNVMGTYPPKPVNGYLITGFLSPPGKPYTYPLDFRFELEEKFGEYPRAPGTSVQPGREKEYVEKIYENMEKRKKITDYLMSNKEWDLFVVVFEETDVLQHAFWKYFTGETEDKKLDFLKDVIPNIYKKFDNYLGGLLQKVDEDTALIVLSDHGFGNLKKVVFINNILLEMNMLKLQRNPRTQLKKFCLRHHLNVETLLKIGEKIGFKIKGAAIEAKREQAIANKLFLSKDDIDWKRTKAFSIGVGGHIFINLKEKEPEGMVSKDEYEEIIDHIVTKLQELRDPETNEKIIEKVYRKEEIYKGKLLDYMPDLSILPKEGYFTLYKEHFISPSFLMKSSVSGSHTLYGVFMMKGCGVEGGTKVSNIAIWDVPAIVLKIFSIDGRYIDGKIDGKMPKELSIKG